MRNSLGRILRACRLASAPQRRLVGWRRPWHGGSSRRCSSSLPSARWTTGSARRRLGALGGRVCDERIVDERATPCRCIARPARLDRTRADPPTLDGTMPVCGRGTLDLDLRVAQCTQRQPLSTELVRLEAELDAPSLDRLPASPIVPAFGSRGTASSSDSCPRPGPPQLSELRLQWLEKTELLPAEAVARAEDTRQRLAKGQHSAQAFLVAACALERRMPSPWLA